MERFNFEIQKNEKVTTSFSSERFIGRVEETKHRVIQLNSLVRKVNFFSSDEDDEFTIQRENGSTEGIFKTWAVPVIPFLEEEKEDELINDLAKGGDGCEVSLGPDSLEIVREWSQSVLNSPRKLEQTLENWRAFSETHDRRLNTIFTNRELPGDKAGRVAELVLRLQTAFAFSAPFYNLEAMIAEKQAVEHNPIQNTTDDDNGQQAFLGGQLDLAAITLPAALKDKVVSDELSWNDLNWEIINRMVQFDDPDEDIVMAMRLAHRIGVDPKDILFAANVLQWIPTSVGGKKQDLEKEEAMAIMSEAIKPQKTSSNIEVARDMNALIRLLNWMPLERSDDNFEKGTGWRYAAVCDTTNNLLREISGGGVLQGDFESVFKEKLEHQMLNLDATSAKGRFILSLINEGKFRPEIERAVEERRDSFLEEVSISLAAAEVTEETVPIKTDLPRVLVGGKAVGLKEAQLIFGEDKVLPGIVITSEAINRWLKSDSQLWGLIQSLEKEDDISEKLGVAQEIRRTINSSGLESRLTDRLNLPPEWDTLAVRSSSSDEDSVNNGAAAGIYESVVGTERESVNISIREVVASAFSDKAVSYRFLEGLKDIPSLAVIISPMIEGSGGAVFSKGNGNDWEAVVGATPQSVVSAENSEFDTFRKNGDEIVSDIKVGFVEDSTIGEIASLVEKAELFLGTGVDMEFVVDSQTGKLTILQLRTLFSRQNHSQETSANVESNTLRIDNLGEIDNLNLDNSPTSIVLGEEVNLDQFQGELFRFLVKNREVVTSVVLQREIPTTSHFANICGSLGINIQIERI